MAEHETTEQELETQKNADAATDDVQFVEDPAFDVDYKGDCAYEVKVTIPPANEKDQSEKMFDELKHDVELPGFRKGRAPKILLERKFGKAIKSEVAAKLASAAFEKLIKDQKLHPIGHPDIDGLKEAVEHDDGQSLTFTMKFEVAPRVELGKYRGINVERPVWKIADADIESDIARMQERYAVYEILDGGVAADGDQVVISFKGTVDGEQFRGGSADNYPYILGSGRVFPEFEKVLRGTSAGDEAKCEVTFPEDYFNEALKGKTASFEIQINEVKRRSIPALTDDFAKQIGYESVEALRKAVANELRAHTENQSNNVAKKHIMDAIIASSSFEIPKKLMERIVNDYREEAIQHLASNRVPASEIEAKDAEIRQQAEEKALREIRSLVVIREVGEAEGVEVKEDDFEKFADVMSRQTGIGLEAVTKYIQEEDRKNQYEDRIFRMKVMDALLALADVTDKEVSLAELESAEAVKEDEE